MSYNGKRQMKDDEKKEKVRSAYEEAKGREARRGAIISTVTALSLLLLKLGIGLAMGSVSVLSESINSFSDLLSGIIIIIFITKAIEPADASHPFGHGKMETLAGFFQTTVIALLGIWLLVTAIGRFINPQPVKLAGLGMLVMVVSMVVTFLVARRLKEMARRTESVALEASSLELSMDLFTNGGVFIALALVWLTGYTYFDPIAAIAVLGAIFYFTSRLMFRTVQDLMDQSLPQTVQEEIKGIMERHLRRHYPRLVGFHRVRTRRSGFRKLVDLHLLGCKYLRLDEAHLLAHDLEDHLRARFPDADVLIHSEPCEEDCTRCEVYEEISKGTYDKG